MRANHRSRLGAFLVIFFFSLSSLLIARPSPEWKTIAPGMDFKYAIAKKPSAVGDSRIFILRMDPKSLAIGSHGHQPDRRVRRTYGSRLGAEPEVLRCDQRGNVCRRLQDASRLYGLQQPTSTTARQNAYQSVAAFEPRDSQSLPRFRIFDLDAPGTFISRTF